MLIKKFLIIILLFESFGFKMKQGDSLIGMWQSLNNANSVLEFTKDNKYILYINGNSFYAPANKNGELNYSIIKQENNWIEFQTRDGNEIVFNGKVEIVDNERIRVYIYKHHNILDVADEYYRTQDFDSFDKIMKKIMEN
jgi:hypothetical protein